MSTLNKVELDLELELLPAWAKQSPDEKKFDKYRGDEESRPRGDRGGPRRDGPRRDGPRPGPGARRDSGPGQRGDNRQGNRPFNRDGRGPGRDRGPRDRFDGPRDRRDEPAPLPDVDTAILPDSDGIAAISRQIKLTGRSYPVFDIAHLVLKSGDRFRARFSVVRRQDKVQQPLFLCEFDDTLWLSQEDARRHLLRKHFAAFYQTDKTPVDPPKGTYTFVAQCGMSGTILGPPNYHDYQKNLVLLHSERFKNMPFDVYKSRVKIVRDEEVVQKWIENQSFKIEYTVLNVPETLKLGSRDEVEKHFRDVHMPNIVVSVDSRNISGKDAQAVPDPTLRRLFQRAFEDQRRFPIKIVTALCDEFAKHGLQFFKKDKSVTHVSVSRPHFLDMEATPVSDSIRSIIEFIDATKRCTRRQIFDQFAPAPKIELTAPVPAPEATAEPTEPTEKTGEAQSASETDTNAEPAAASPAPPARSEPEMTPVQRAVNADLHWLIHQGHVLEFSNGIVETAKRPMPKPVQKPKSKSKKARVPTYMQAYLDAAFTLI